ncbi:MAG: DUF3108 domain-containing protein [Deltaproteobacteria bacterium]|nr:DUF3108 domain-containing protein [Deltaproteobacteria bacterium]
MLLLRQRILMALVVMVSVCVNLPTFAETKRQRRSTTAPKKPLAKAPTPAPTAPLVFVGEQLAYTATLNELPAGEGELSLRTGRNDGHEVYRFVAQARSNELVDYLYRRRDTAEATFAAANYMPVFFRLRSTENERQREYGVRYDPQTQTLVGQVKRRDRVKERTLPAGTVHDPASAFYWFRSQNFLPGSTLETEVFTGRDHYRVRARVIGKEKITLGTVQRQAIRLQPEVFSLDNASQDNLLPSETTLWVTADASHTPLRIESHLSLGQVVVELTGQ